jgi:fructokinase
MPEVVSIGEALIDFLSVEKGVLIENTTAFTLAPGGAPANVAAAVSRLGGSAGFVGKVGNDSFGLMIRNALSGVGVDLGMLIMDGRVNTSLAFIAVKPNGEPDFTFFRNRCGADLALEPEEIDERYLERARILHYGSISFTGEPLKSATLRAIRIVKTSGGVLSYDPNLRPSLWDSLARAKSEMEMGMRHADIVKMTVEELEFVTGTGRLRAGCEKILKYGPQQVTVTRGGGPCYFFNGRVEMEVPAFEVVPVDTTGGGDAFVGGMLLKILERLKRGGNFRDMDRGEIEGVLRFAHACGALTVTRKGVIPVLPVKAEVEDFLKKG